VNPRKKPKKSKKGGKKRGDITLLMGKDFNHELLSDTAGIVGGETATQGRK